MCGPRTALSINPMPSRYQGLMLRGGRAGRLQAKNDQMSGLQLLPGASFFDQHATQISLPGAKIGIT